MVGSQPASPTVSSRRCVDQQQLFYFSLLQALLGLALHRAARGAECWVARNTRFRAGRSNSSFFDLRTGQPVQVISHRSGNLEIADLVVL
jgi:hypothetical protein